MEPDNHTKGRLSHLFSQEEAAPQVSSWPAIEARINKPEWRFPSALLWYFLGLVLVGTPAILFTLLNQGKKDIPMAENNVYRRQTNSELPSKNSSVLSNSKPSENPVTTSQNKPLPAGLQEGTPAQTAPSRQGLKPLNTDLQNGTATADNQAIHTAPDAAQATRINPTAAETDTKAPLLPVLRSGLTADLGGRLPINRKRKAGPPAGTLVQPLPPRLPQAQQPLYPHSVKRGVVPNLQMPATAASQAAPLLKTGREALLRPL